MAEDFVGARVRSWRLKRGVSQRTLAGLAGISQGYVSQIEAGLKEIDKRSTLIRLADALQVSVADLTGQPYAPGDATHARALAFVPAIRAALISLVYLDLADAPARPMEELADHTRRLMAARQACDYAEAAGLIAPLLLDLGAAAYSPASTHRPDGLRLLTLATYHASFLLKYLGFVDLPLAAAERCSDAARELGAPEFIGLSDYARLHHLPPESRGVGRKLAAAATERLAHESSPEALQTYGMLHLTCAWTDALADRPGDAQTHLGEAAAVAARLGGDPADGGFAELQFGPTNIAQWRVSLELETGSPGRAVELARAVDPKQILSRSRRTQFHIEHGAALAATRRADGEALTQFITAERIAPQRVRLSPIVRDNVGVLLRRARANAGVDHLRELAARVGVA
ncbi:helix-turn-helix domain-containing protein [Paractinoplanes toevensis]|uniref:Transcriptional regulator n=1 Tax=Paractinoplanes toevensis TaxID=571911 RepID=A0A920BNW2_9ACTN|nr:helix-turn-helix transcriptional regulator [Actinoplanes toevensis]GIM95908.1 transcriptional regulator [Actinoplanes toevensis]